MTFSNKKVKILYLADSYASTVAGVKISLFKEMRRRGFSIDFDTVHSGGRNVIDGQKLLNKLKKGSYTDLWVAHTWVSYNGCSLADINKLGVKVLGFGFSDPYGWNNSRLNQYNFYATHSARLAKKIKTKPVTYFTTSCDLSFHKKVVVPKTTDVLFIGCGIHPQFKDKYYRLGMITKLRKIFRVKICGKNWGKVGASLPVFGNKFLREIHKAKIGLDLQEQRAPLAHRLFEFPACGVPIITRNRYDVSSVFNVGKNMLVYNTVEDLIRTIRMLLTNTKRHAEYTNTSYMNSITNHTIKQRVSKLLSWLDKVY